MKEFVSGPKPRELGSIENPIIDSHLTVEEALRPNPEFFLAQEVFDRQVVLPVRYLSFDGKYHEGQIVVDKDLEEDVRDFFEFLLLQNFPVNKVVPVSRLEFNDAVSMAENNSSAFNPRNISGTDRPSNHAFGRAIDINPFLNPYIKNGTTEPKGAVYDEDAPGTFASKSPIVEFLTERGWKWGGEFEELKDYHHFEKPDLEAKEALEEYISYFAKHLLPPYTFELPDHIPTIQEEDYYHYMCRGNAAQAISGFMNMVASDAEMLRLNNQQKTRIKELENLILKFSGDSLRTKEDMALMKNAIEEVVEILSEQRKKI